MVYRKPFVLYVITSLQARYADLPASPAGLLARARFAHSAKFTNISEKKCVSIDSKCSKRHRNAKKLFYPYDRLRAEQRSAKSEAQPYLPHFTRRVPRSVHAKFHADWTKTVGARGIQTNTQKEGVIICIPKADKPRNFIKNWRPISLLNIVYKIGSAIL